MRTLGVGQDARMYNSSSGGNRWVVNGVIYNSAEYFFSKPLSMTYILFVHTSCCTYLKVYQKKGKG